MKHIIKQGVKKIIGLTGYTIIRTPQTPSPDVVTLPAIGKKKGDTLFSYGIHPFFDKNFTGKNNPWGHTSGWESYTIAKIFQSLGFEVDVISYLNEHFQVKKNYSIFFDIHTAQQKLVSKFNMKSKNILYATGASNEYQNNAELLRVKDFERRKKTYYQPKRIVAESALNERTFDMADEILLLGNDWTKSTFPKKHHKKITLITASAAPTHNKKENYIPEEKGFLYFSGTGNVHKGLDLLLDFFIKNKKYKLHVCTPLQGEDDFWRVYQDKLSTAKNIILDGHILPDSDKAKSIIEQCFCFISPSCSEGFSTSTATAMSMGLYPIISVQNGVDLPKDAGMYLTELNEDAIAQAIDKVYKMDEKELTRQIIACQHLALTEYSREAFTKKMTKALSEYTSNI